MNLNNTRPFNTDGPVEISAADFATYKTTVEHLKFDDMFHYWLNENNPDPVRRLMIRDLLRQGNCNQSHVYYHTSDHPSRMVYTDGAKFGKILSRNFTNRPKLLQEFFSELLFILDQKMIITPKRKSAEQYVSTLDLRSYLEVLEFLVPFLSPTEADRIWQHEKYLATHLDFDERVDTYLRLLNFERCKFPANIRQEA